MNDFETLLQGSVNIALLRNKTKAQAIEIAALKLQVARLELRLSRATAFDLGAAVPSLLRRQI